MDKREIIIKEYEKAISKARGEGWDFVDLTVEDAETILELLKEQEPHLLTLDEIQNAKDIPAYWFEDDEGYMTSSLSTIYDWYGHNISFVTEDKEGYLEGYTYPDTQYGKTWRCWSSKPTDEQRKKVQWDENKAGPVQD